MKVLMQIRENYLTGPGGDTIQFLKTKEYLEKEGVDVNISTELEPDLTDYDLVHLFNLTRIQETYIQARNAVKYKKPYALSTIYWPFGEINEEGYNGIRKIVYSILNNNQIESVKALYKYLFKGERNKGCVKLIFGNYEKMQKWVVEHASICLPNALTEMKKLEETMHLQDIPFVVVPNAIDLTHVKKAYEDQERPYKQYKNYLICVARISRRKNQCLLLEALKGTNYKCLFVGKSSPGELDYYEQFKSMIRENHNISYIESIQNGELYKLYKEARVSVLPSWFETPGLVNLEAAAMGCNVVLTDKGTTRDYFGDAGFYCGTNSQELIDAINLAYDAPFNEKLKQRIITEYTWDNAAHMTIEGYKNILK